MHYKFISKTLNPIRNIFWYHSPGITVSWVIIDGLVYKPLEYFDGSYEEELGAWLTKNIGKQGKQWDWRYIKSMQGTNQVFKIYIKISKSKQHLASITLLRWATT